MARKTVVIADDFKNTRWVVEFSLKEFDVDILSAEDGEQALQYFDGTPIHLLITDYNMPKMNGLELVKKIKEIETYRTMPVLVLSTDQDENKKRAAMDAKITAWIKKPYKQEKFTQIVKKVLGI